MHPVAFLVVVMHVADLMPMMMIVGLGRGHAGSQCAQAGKDEKALQDELLDAHDDFRWLLEKLQRSPPPMHRTSVHSPTACRPNGTARRRKAPDLSTKSGACCVMVRLAGIEPTTPWFVVNTNNVLRRPLSHNKKLDFVKNQ
jgi:hypothetical protein